MRNLVWYCPNCAAWYSNDTLPKTMLADEPINGRYNRAYCNCNGEPELLHAHETGQQTPYMELKAELLKEERNALQMRINKINQILIDECWEE